MIDTKLISDMPMAQMATLSIPDLKTGILRLARSVAKTIAPTIAMTVLVLSDGKKLKLAGKKKKLVNIKAKSIPINFNISKLFVNYSIHESYDHPIVKSDQPPLIFPWYNPVYF